MQCTGYTSMQVALAKHLFIFHQVPVTAVLAEALQHVRFSVCPIFSSFYITDRWT